MYWKDQWQPGEKSFFEYHCFESLDSADSVAWLHSHQQVTILQEVESDAFEGTLLERAEEGVPKVYEVKFSDGLIYTVFEDELLTNPEGYERNEPLKE